MIRLATLALLLPLAACGSDEPPVVIDGVDPVQSDGDLAPDASLAPEAEMEPGSDLAPEDVIETTPPIRPDGEANPIPTTDE